MEDLHLRIVKKGQTSESATNHILMKKHEKKKKKMCKINFSIQEAVIYEKFYKKLSQNSYPENNMPQRGNLL